MVDSAQCIERPENGSGLNDSWCSLCTLHSRTRTSRDVDKFCQLPIFASVSWLHELSVLCELFPAALILFYSSNLEWKLKKGADLCI